MGDFDINLILHDLHNGTSKYLDTLFNFGLLPLITLPSRITNNSSSLLDHISSNTKNKFIDNGIIYSTLSDHYPIFCINNANYKFENLAKQNTFKRKINDNTITIIKELVSVVESL